MVSCFPLRLPTGAHPLHTPLCRGCLFLVGCCVSRCQSSAVQRQRCTSFFIFCRSICHPQMIIRHPPHTFCRDRVSSMMIPTPLTPTFSWLLRLTSKWRPPKAKTLSLSLIFDGLHFSAPSKRTGRGDREPATGRLLWTHEESRRQDLGAPLPYPWRERVKLLEGRVAAAHLDVVGCGLWVVGCGLCVVGSFVGSRALVSFDTHFVDHPGKQFPLKIMVIK
jgi:hypothetical protein